MKYIIVFILLSSNLYAQNKRQNEQNVVIKVCYAPKGVLFDGKPCQYAIIRESKLDDFQIINDTSLVPGLIYLITKNGGYSISDDTVDEKSQVCCSTGNIEQHLVEYMNSSYHFNYKIPANFELFSILKRRKMNTLKYTYDINMHKKKPTQYQESGIYNVSFWIADIDYCLCDSYHAPYSQHFYGNKFAYLRAIKKIYRIKKEKLRKMKQLFKAVLENN